MHFAVGLMPKCNDIPEFEAFNSISDFDAHILTLQSRDLGIHPQDIMRNRALSPPTAIGSDDYLLLVTFLVAELRELLLNHSWEAVLAMLLKKWKPTCYELIMVQLRSECPMTCFYGATKSNLVFCPCS